MYDNFNRKAVERVEAGDICAFAGLGDVCIGETVCAREAPVPLPTITVPSNILPCQARPYFTVHKRQLHGSNLVVTLQQLPVKGMSMRCPPSCVVNLLGLVNRDTRMLVGVAAWIQTTLQGSLLLRSHPRVCVYVSIVPVVSLTSVIARTAHRLQHRSEGPALQTQKALSFSVTELQTLLFV